MRRKGNILELMLPSAELRRNMRNDEIRDIDHRRARRDVDLNHRDASASSASSVSSASAIVVTTTHLTNPGIIDRLECDVNDHLCHFGFRLIRTDRCDAVLVAPRPPLPPPPPPSVPPPPPPGLHRPAAPTRGCDGRRDGCRDFALAASTTTNTTDRTRIASSPLLRVRVLDPDIVPTIGPMLRTYVRLSDVRSSPIRLRAIVDCDYDVVVAPTSSSSYVISAYHDGRSGWDGVNDGGARRGGGRASSKHGRGDVVGHEEPYDDDDAAAAASRRVAHQVHMLVRNSMGSALCMDLAIILPRYRCENDVKTTTAKTATTTSTTGTTTMEGKEKPCDGGWGGAEDDSMTFPLTSRSVMDAMANNPDACYPSVRLLERGIDCYPRGGGANDDATIMDAIVRTRMCTVRHTPALFRWLHSLSWPVDDVHYSVDDENVEDDDGMKHPSYDGIATSTDEAQSTRHAVVPIVVACIEKVANLHRVMMLCHDRCGDRCDENDGRRDEVQDDGVDAGADRHIRQNADGDWNDDVGLRSTPECPFTLSNVVVVLPNIEGGGRRDAARWQEFEDAVNNFHTTIFADGGMEVSHRPTFVYEKHAVAVISGMIEQRRRASSSFLFSLYHSESRKLPPPVFPLSSLMVGIDLHPAALTLDGSYLVTASPISPAIRAIREAGAIVFGYESSGIPIAIAGTLDSWVQIPSRSSINIVAAMSIVLDALFG